MIIGNGQIAQALTKYSSKGIVFFASGVANSGCVEQSQFNREKNLLKKSLAICDGKFVYFSSCALSAFGYPLNMYYDHKLKMENLVRDIADSYLIIRLPQVLGDFKRHPTIFNYFLFSILSGSHFNVCDKAYRYVIDIDDVAHVAHGIASNYGENQIVDLANPFRYSVLEIVRALEIGLGVPGNYSLIAKDDAYFIDTTECERLLFDLGIDCGFGEVYLYRKIQYRVDRYLASCM